MSIPTFNVEPAVVVPITVTNPCDEPCLDGFEHVAYESEIAAEDVLLHDLFDSIAPVEHDVAMLVAA